MSTEQEVLSFWDKTFAEAKPFTIKERGITADDDLSKELFSLGRNAHRILDVGCGCGEMLIRMALHEKGRNELLGIDGSPFGIRIARESMVLSGARHLDFRVGGLAELQMMAGASFDGILSSNFLDVTPLRLAQGFLKEISRLLKRDGVFLLKINFHTDPTTISNPRYGLSEEGLLIDGILRSNNLTTEKWLGMLRPDFILLRQGEFARLGPSAPKDRFFVLRRK
jgi:SAM-dependent methyltransferase